MKLLLENGVAESLEVARLRRAEEITFFPNQLGYTNGSSRLADISNMEGELGLPVHQLLCSRKIVPYISLPNVPGSPVSNGAEMWLMLQQPLGKRLHRPSTSYH